MSNQVGKGIRKVRELLDMTQEELACACHVSEEFIMACEMDVLEPTLDDIDHIAVGLGVPVSFLFMFADESYDPLVENFQRIASKSLMGRCRHG